MRYAYAGMLFLLIVAVTLACGCASSPAVPGTASKPPAATTGPSPTAVPATLRAGALFGDGVQWFEYRLTAGGDASDVRFDRTTAVIGGVTLKDDRVTMAMDAPDMVVVMDRYYDAATGRQVGSRTRTTSASTTLAGPDVAAAGDRCQGGDIAAIYASGNWPLTDAGAGTITAGGRPYACTKYAVGDAGEHGTAWVAPGVPVPVKIESGASGDTSTWELAGWG